MPQKCYYTCINPFLYRFGVDRKRCSQNCSTMESGVGKVSARELDQPPFSDSIVRSVTGRSRVKSETM
ncbi:hypothetical protein ANCCAN_25106 [Ancylostoma caninum]|uniref:Uncharacterized protein n=1 Tax=Ancylostoma caninum TaxID=29170 RepID=A0A368FE42_ANCCA|nr:hypothetical protein ANCCAN_25106 [Ancylostoma caninum]